VTKIGRPFDDLRWVGEAEDQATLLSNHFIKDRDAVTLWTIE